MWIKAFSNSTAHASLVQITASSDDSPKKRMLIRNKLRKSGLCGADAAVSCLAGMLSRDDHVRAQSMRCLLLLEYSDIQKAMACIPKNSIFIKIIDILHAGQSLPFSEIMEIITVRCSILRQAATTGETGETLLTTLIDSLLEKGFLEEILILLNSRIGSYLCTPENFGKIFDALSDNDNETFIKLIQTVTPDTLAKDSERFPKVLKRFIKVEMSGCNIPPKIFYTRILPAFQSLDCTLLSSKELSHIPYNFFHLFNTVEGDRKRRSIVYKILESTPTFCIEENAETLPDMGLFVRNPSYGFKILLHFQAFSGNAARAATRAMTDIFSMYKQCRWISESFDSALTSYMNIPADPDHPKVIEPSIRMLLETNLIDNVRMADIFIWALRRIQRNDVAAMLNALRAFTKLCGLDRSAFESFTHRSTLLMGPAAYLFRTSNLPGRGRALRSSIVKFFIYTNFQSFFEIVFHLARLYIEALSADAVSDNGASATEIRYTLLNFLLLAEGITSREVEYIQRDTKACTKQKLAASGSIPDESPVMNALCIAGTANAVHTLKDLRALIATRGDKTCDWVLQQLIATFGIRADKAETSIASAYRKFTIFTIGWADKPFSDASWLQQMSDRIRDTQQYIESEIESQKATYAKHLEMQLNGEQLLAFFKENALARIRCSYSDALATFYFFLQHIALNTYVSLAIDMVGEIVSLTGTEANCVVFFIRCALDEMRRSEIPSVQAQSHVLLKSFAQKFTLLIADHSMSLESALNICTLAKETMEFICSSDESKQNVVKAIDETTTSEPQTETAQTLLVLKAAFEKQQVSAPVESQRSQASQNTRQESSDQRPGHKRDRYGRHATSSRSSNSGRHRY